MTAWSQRVETGQNASKKYEVYVYENLESRRRAILKCTAEKSET